MTTTDSANPLKLTCGLFLSDLKKAITCILLCSAVSMYGTLFPQIINSDSFLPLLIERFIQLSCVYWIVSSWVKRLRIEKKKFTLILPLRLFTFGFLLWGTLIFPILLITVYPSIAPFSFIFVALGIYYSVSYFFYFISTLLSSQTRLKEVVQLTKDLSQNKFSIIIKIFFYSGLFGLTYYSILSAFYPDGRNVVLQAMSQLWLGIFFVLSTYLGLSYGLLSIPDSVWREEKLDPYKKERLETLSKIGKPIHVFFSPQGLFVISLLGLFCFLGNRMRWMTLPPPSSVTLVNAVAEDSTVELTLKLKDDEFLLRGTYPLMFALRGEQGSTVSAYPKKIVDTETKEDESFIIPGIESSKLITLSFETDRSGKALTELEDLYLWYNKVKLFNVRVKEK